VHFQKIFDDIFDKIDGGCAAFCARLRNAFVCGQKISSSIRKKIFAKKILKFFLKIFFGETSVVLPSAKPLSLVAPPFLAVRYEKVSPNPFKTFIGNASRFLAEKFSKR